MKEFTEAGVDHQVNFYGGATHGFAHPTNGGDNYSSKWDRRSWNDMLQFFDDIFIGTSYSESGVGMSTTAAIIMPPSSYRHDNAVESAHGNPSGYGPGNHPVDAHALNSKDQRR